MSKRFTGKVAFITGGATGLGRDFARALHQEGAAVVLADIDADGAETSAKSLDSSDAPALGLACDVADPDSVASAVAAAVGQFGGIDILINNAARHHKKYNQPFSALTHDEIRGLFDVNVIGIVNCALACQASMAARGNGAIVNIASAGGYIASTPYGVTKVAVRGLTIALANELSGDAIRVNCVAPTMTATESALEEYSDEEFERSIATRQLIRRRAGMDDISKVVLFLCSEEAGFITGESIRVTGGASMSI